ncbi:MAG: histidinol-phosphate transaminase [Mariprofundales bacterium]
MSFNWSQHAVKQCLGLRPYIPGKPIETLLTERGLTTAIKLASNENPDGTSPKVLNAIGKAATQCHLYPDGNAGQLKQALAKKHHVQTEQILLGNGSNEVLELVIRTFAGSSDRVIYAQRGFIVYALATAAAGAIALAIPEINGLQHDLAAMATAAQHDNAKIVCIANPNNPTGSLCSATDLQIFLDALPRQIIILLDEAYYEYISHIMPDSVNNLHHPGLVITRTFSKAYGLAGLRIGYAVADAVIIELVNRMREPFNVNMLAQSAALAALDDDDWLQEHVQTCLKQREYLEAQLKECGLFVAPSYGNFVLLRHENALLLHDYLEGHGIIVRPLTPYNMQDILRISVGTAQDNKSLIQCLRQYIQNSPAKD